MKEGHSSLKVRCPGQSKEEDTHILSLSVAYNGHCNAGSSEDRRPLMFNAPGFR